MTKQLLSAFSILVLALALAVNAEAKEITVRGRLQKTVEPGGWLIVSGSDKYLILNARQFQNESWFKESSEVEARGDTKPDVMTTYMEGVPFAVRLLQPVTQGRTPGSGGDALRLTRVLVSGDSVMRVQPDTAIVTISVVTQEKRALDAQQANANLTSAVIKALKASAGAGAEIKTSGYNLQPQRLYRENQPPTITGYEARNSVTVTLSDLSKVGSLIDAATQAGANDVTGVSFTLREDRSAREQALAEATREAVSKAEVIARVLGGRIVRVIEIQEEGTTRPLPILQREYTAARTTAMPTPIEVGTLDVTSRVQVTAEVEAER